MNNDSIFFRIRMIALYILIFAVASSCSDNGSNPTSVDDSDPDPPPSNTLSTSFESDDPIFLPGEIQRILVEGTTLTDDEIAAQIADTLEFTLYRDTTVQSEALFIMVPEITPGSHTLTFMLEDQEQTLDFAIEEFEIIEDPAAYTNSVVDSVETGLQTLLNQTEETEAKELIEEALNDLQQEKQKISSLSEEEIKLLARFLKTHLDATDSSGQNKMVFASSSSSDVCSEFSDKLVDNIATAAVSVFAIDAGNIVLSIPGLGTAIGSIAIATGIGGLYYSIKNVKESITDYYNECLNLTDGKNSILKEITNSKNSAFSNRLSNNAAADFEFQHNISRAFTVESTFEVPQEIQSPLQELRDALDFILNKLPDSWVDVLFKDFTETGQDDPAQFGIQNISDDRIEGTDAAEQDRLSITFSYKEGQMPTNTQEFTFELVDKENTDQITEIEASLRPVAVPVVFDDNITVPKNGSRTDTLRAEMAESFEIVDSPAAGTVTLDDPNVGVYTYTPETGFEGEDQFTFKAINEEGESNVAAVNITVAYETAPEAFDDDITVSKDGSRTDTLQAERARSFEIVDNPSSGTVTLDNSDRGVYTYTPDSGFEGDDQFTFRASNGLGASNVAAVQITVAIASGFQLASNGVTITCNDAEPGDTGVVDGVTYTAVDRSLLEIKRDNGDDLSKVCTSPVTDMSNMFNESVFEGYRDFNQDISSWDVSNVNNMSYMFYEAISFNQDISSWDVGQVTDMVEMFANATAFNQDIGSWDVSQVTSMSSMFRSADVFNQDIGGWHVSQVTDMSYIFSAAYAFNQDIGGWDVSQVTSMDSMFDGARSFNQYIGNWDVSEVTIMESMFYEARSFNQNLNSWCVELIKTKPNGFDGNSGFEDQEDKHPQWGTCPGGN